MSNSHIDFMNVSPGATLGLADIINGLTIQLFLQALNLKARDNVTVRFSGFESDGLTQINGTDLVKTMTVEAEDEASGILSFCVSREYLKPISVGMIRAIATLDDGTSYAISAPIDLQIPQLSDGPPNLI